MSKYDRIDHSPEKEKYSEMMHANLEIAVSNMDFSYEYIAESIVKHELTIKGHHIKYPFLYYFHHRPDTQQYFSETGMPVSDIPIVKNTIVGITRDFISALIDTDRVLDYTKDILGSTSTDIFIYGSKFIQLYLSILTLPADTPVKLTANKDLDEICKSCVVGEHCKLEGDKFSKTFDAIFVHQLTKEIESSSMVVSREHLMSNEEYITEAKTNLGSFRKGLALLYPHKKHLYDSDSDSY